MVNTSMIPHLSLIHICCGNPIPLPGTPDGIYRVYSRDRQFLCLSRAAGGTLTSIKNFFGA